MADKIDVELRGDRKIGLSFDRFPTKLKSKLRVVISAQLDKLLARILEEEPHDKGALRAATKKQMFDDQDKVSGRVAVVDKKQLRKAGALEYGGAGRDFEVKGHFAKLDHNFAEKLAEPLYVFVEAHDRTLNMAGKLFIRGPAHAIQDQTIAAMREAVGQSIAESDSEQ
jgi:hypothetical protein